MAVEVVEGLRGGAEGGDGASGALGDATTVAYNRCGATVPSGTTRDDSARVSFLKSSTFYCQKTFLFMVVQYIYKIWKVEPYYC